MKNTLTAEQSAALDAFIDSLRGTLPPVVQQMADASRSMHVDDRFFEFVKQEEGLRLEAYRDTGGILTIGYGHTGSDVYPGRVITEAEAKNILIKDVDWAVRAVNSDIVVPLGQNQFNALVSFVFNIGSGQFHSSTLRRILNQGDYAGVPAQLRRWIYDQQGNPVLVNRREREVALWNEPTHVDTVNVSS